VSSRASAQVTRASDAAAKVQRVFDSKGSLLNTVASDFSSVLEQETALYQSVRDAKNKALDAIAEKTNNAVRDTTYTDAFNQWLTDYQTAFNNDVLTAKQR
jgi:hypothetical protein